MPLTALPCEHGVLPSIEQQMEDHRRVFEGYLDTHTSRNHREKTRLAEERYLNKWFRKHSVEGRSLFVWEAMKPILGRERVVDYVKGEMDRVASTTIAGRVCMLRRLFDYVLEWPYIPESGGVSLYERYGPLEQPVLIYDYPSHVCDERKEDAPLIRTELTDFYETLRSRVGDAAQSIAIAARNYTMVVVAGESGLRIHEICALELERDLLFSANRLQTRAGKGYRGSGPRVRQTLFTPFCQATIKHYLQHIRSQFKRWSHCPYVFLSQQGNPVSEPAAMYALKKLAGIGRNAGLRMPPRFGWHSLRRSFATIYMEENPGSPWVLMEMLGHINPSTLHRYVRHPRAYHERVMDDVIVSLMQSTR